MRAKQSRIDADRGKFIVNKARGRNNNAGGAASVRTSMNSAEYTVENSLAVDNQAQLVAPQSERNRKQKNFILKNKRQFDTSKRVNQYGKLKNHEYGPLNKDLDIVEDNSEYMSHAKKHQSEQTADESRESYGTAPGNSSLSRHNVVGVKPAKAPLDASELKNQ